jgi:hypothetical protein
MNISALEAERDDAKLRIDAAIAVKDGAAALEAMREVDELNRKIQEAIGQGVRAGQ